MKPNYDTTGEAIAYNTIAAEFEYTPSLPQILTHLKSSLLISTYQAQKVFVVGADGDKLSVSHIAYEQPMGIAVMNDRIAIGSRSQIHFYNSNHDAGRTAEPVGKFDSCFVPHTDRHTGKILSHDLAWGKDGLIVVNTLFSCLCTLDSTSSFVPIWKPSFISELASEDRCHLNGLAVENGVPKYVTTLSTTDTAQGWRPNKAKTGSVVDVRSGEVILTGLSMPHSPRIHNGKLWVLNSGDGELGHIDINRGRYESVESVPGFTRGLCFAGQFAFVGLSRIRESNVFGGLKIGARADELCCGLAVVDLVSGKAVAKLQFNSFVEEVFAVEVLPQCLNPLLSGAIFEHQPREVWIVPDAARHVPCKFATPEGLDSLPISESKGTERYAADLVNEGNRCQDSNDSQAAIVKYKMALGIDPTCVPALQNLGYLLMNGGFTEEAVKCYERLLTISDTPMNHLLNALVVPIVYDSVEEIDRWRVRSEKLLDQMIERGLTVDTTNTMIPTTFLFAYQGKNDRILMQRLSRIIKGPSVVAARSATIAKRDRIRIGFLSAYLRDHTIGMLNKRLIREFDRSQFDVTVISAVARNDSVAELLRQNVDQWIQVPRDIMAARESILSLNLDLLVFTDVGMDALSSSLAWSRMAPIQCASWGHPNTTGSPKIDFFQSSELLDSAQAQDHYTEQLVRLPGLGISYDRPVLYANPKCRQDFGLDEAQHLYLCPQTLFKFHPEFDSILNQILSKDSLGCLVVIEAANDEWNRRLKQRWERTMPKVHNRVKWLSAMPRLDYLALLRCGDCMLDPMCFGGGNSTLEAIAMGTPVVSMRGEFLRSRISAAIFDQMTLSDCLPTTTEEYVELAIRYATDPEFRAAMSRTIAKRSHVVFDTNQAVRDFERWSAQVCGKPTKS